ncbi:hypothetical protein [Jeotgalibacillus marinus]|uniref:Uncharacterized protein n=1 Tax=Jeotgalibacillus marinus TaxID=86667 RepID=A0ABV3Q4P6_9BACL
MNGKKIVIGMVLLVIVMLIVIYLLISNFEAVDLNEGNDEDALSMVEIDNLYT